MSTLAYHLGSPQVQSHHLAIGCHVDGAACTQPRRLSLATWTPGSYKIRDYARHVLRLRLHDADGHELPLQPIDKSSWLLPASNDGWRIEMLIYAREDSVRGALINAERGLFDGAGIFPRIEGLEHCPLTLSLTRPDGCEQWRVATAMTATQVDAAGWGEYHCADWWDLIDQPIGMGEFQSIEYSAGGVPHRLAIFGRCDTDTDSLSNDLQRLCEQHIAQMGEAPHDRYLFLLRLGAGGDGGLEHRWSSTLAADRRALPRSLSPRNADYRRFLGLCSHEYFHLWNVKRMRPQRFAESGLDREAYSEDLWVYEGVTSYLDDYSLRRAGLFSISEYLAVLGQALTRLAATPGRFAQSLAQSSRDAWIRLYQPAEHQAFSTVSYYLKGSLVALALDLQLRLATAGEVELLTVLRQLWRDSQQGAQPLPEGQLETTTLAQVPAAARPAMQEFFDAAVRGTADPDFPGLLARFGITARCRAPTLLGDPGGTAAASIAGRALVLPVDLGLRLAPEDLQVLAVDPGSPVQLAGIQPGDTLLAWNGEKLQRARLHDKLRDATAGETVSLHWFSDERLQQAEVRLPPAAEICWYLEVDPAADGPTSEWRRSWLGADS